MEDIKYMAIYRTTSPFREFIIKSKSIRGLMQKATRLDMRAVIDHLKIYQKDEKGYFDKYLFTCNRVNIKAPDNSFKYGKWG